MTKAAHDRDLRFHGPIGLVPALVTLKDANFGAVPFDRIGRASSQMGIAAAFAAAERSNKLQFLDDEGTLLHSTAPDPRRSSSMRADKKYGIRTTSPPPVKKLCKSPLEFDPLLR